MVREYVDALYVPAARASRALAGPADGAPFAAARELTAWKQRIRAAWPGVRIEHIEAGDGERGPGGTLPVWASVALGELSPGDVTVEVVCGRVTDEEDIVEPEASPLAPAGPATDGTVRYAGEARLGRPGPFGYTVRVVPRHPLLASTAELGMVTYPDAPKEMTNGDLR
jgi:glycogen phosphorylase